MDSAGEFSSTVRGGLRGDAAYAHMAGRAQNVRSCVNGHEHIRPIMAIERNRSAISGEQMFDEAVEYFGAENVTSFAANRVARMPSNLDAFNANLGHMSYEDAAANTFTGQMVAKFGLTVVTVDKRKLIGKLATTPTLK